MGEFKQFNLKNIEKPKSQATIVYFPSSIFERALHPDWEPYFANEYDLLEEICIKLNISKDKLVVRCHPQWKTYGKDLEKFHFKQTSRHGFTFISSADKTDTSLLIDEASIAIVNGSSTAFEAGFKGKIVLNIAPTFYDSGVFCQNISDFPSVENIETNIDQKSIQEATLRAWYYLNFKRMSFTDYIIPRTGYDYLYEDIPAANIENIFINNNSYSNTVQNFSIYDSFNANKGLFTMRRKPSFFLWELIDRCTR